MRFEPNFEITTDQEFVVQARVAGRRLDQYLKARYKDYSRTLFTRLISEGKVLVNGQTVRPSYKTRTGDEISFGLPALERPYLKPEPMDLAILHEDSWLVAINKPPGIVMHPSRGHQGGTLVNGLLHHFQDNLSSVRSELRPGIIHRLDRDTSGVVLVAKNDQAHWKLAAQFENRTVKKEYLALIWRLPEKDDFEVDLPIGKHPANKDKMAILAKGGKEARTRFHILERYSRQALIVARPQTGRTHQIRLHLQAIGHPILADEQYSGSGAFYPHEINHIRGTPIPSSESPLLQRQALHAHRITFWHPILDQDMTIEAPIPEDILTTLGNLRDR
jgi:23S rRNA pseudouridine1911/1915/1917 synthase